MSSKRECVEIKIGWREFFLALAIGFVLFAGGFFAGIVESSPWIKFLGLK
jgi:hypothetical protein